jgi:hypothetical protein
MLHQHARRLPSRLQPPDDLLRQLQQIPPYRLRFRDVLHRQLLQARLLPYRLQVLLLNQHYQPRLLLPVGLRRRLPSKDSDEPRPWLHHRSSHRRLEKHHR